MTSESTVPRPFVLLTVALCVAALGLTVITVLNTGPQITWLVIAMAVLALLSENFAPVIAGYSISLSMPLAIAAMLMQGPIAAALVSGVSAFKNDAFRSPRGLVLMAFNMGQLVLVSLAAGWSYVLLGGRVLSVNGPLEGADFPRMLLALFAVVFVASVGNFLMLALGMSVLYGGRFGDAFSSTTMHIPSFMALVAVGYLMAQVTATNIWALGLFVFPLLVARDLYQRFKNLKDAYADTIRSLIHALEAKDPYTRGHSERVAEYAVQIAHSMGLDAKSCERLEYAGLMHDLGKIALPKGILVKPGALTDDEMDAMRNHPAAGADMIARIPPLAELAELVVQHHERFSGGGYPSGQSAECTHLLSRILTVADAYDAMTSNRAYRNAMEHEQAQRVLIEASGTQFDPSVVDAFSRVWPRPVVAEDAAPTGKLVQPAGGVVGEA